MRLLASNDVLSSPTGSHWGQMSPRINTLMKRDPCQLWYFSFLIGKNVGWTKKMKTLTFTQVPCWGIPFDSLTQLVYDQVHLVSLSAAGDSPVISEHIDFRWPVGHACYYLQILKLYSKPKTSSNMKTCQTWNHRGNQCIFFHLGH